MVILPPRRDSEKDSLANYTPGAAVEKIYIYQCISVFLRCFFFFFYTHTLPLMESVQASPQNHH